MEIEKVAVLLSAYNGEKYIEQQIDSILEQNVDCELTLFVRDDGSTDTTLEILKKKSDMDSHIVVIQGENCGGNKSFFELLRMANCLSSEYKYFALSDQDDIWDSDKVQVGIDAIREKRADGPVLYGSVTRPVNEDLEIIPRKRKTLKPITFYNSIIQNIIAGHTQIMNKQLLGMICDADAAFLYGHDSFIVNVAVLCGTVVFDTIPHASYRQHSNNQLGTSNFDRISWIKQRINRIRKGDSKQYARQIEYIAAYCDGMMTVEQRKEIDEFLKSRKDLLSRIRYLQSKKLYRQEKFDDVAFTLLYLVGGYNT